MRAGVLVLPHNGHVALALCERAMRRMRSGVGRSRSTVKPDGTSDNSELGSRTGHGKENVFCRYGHPSRIIHRAAPKVRKNRYMNPHGQPRSTDHQENSAKSGDAGPDGAVVGGG